MKTAILMMAHGSRIAEANDAAREVAAMVKEMTG
ncbi:MAG TPA: sirohydrochlorin cobaltochelatase, partial [Candidatus Binatia bacterium]|nr:sirohydrochlorin cobaltochelatase [Candidatus Binatia bacterium]